MKLLFYGLQQTYKKFLKKYTSRFNVIKNVRNQDRFCFFFKLFTTNNENNFLFRQND